MDNHRSGFFQGDSGPKTKSTTCAAKKLESQTTCISICMSAMKRLDLTASSVQVPACVNSPCLGATRNVKLDVLQFMSVEISEAKKLNILEVGFKKTKPLKSRVPQPIQIQLNVFIDSYTWYNCKDSIIYIKLQLCTALLSYIRALDLHWPLSTCPLWSFKRPRPHKWHTGEK